MKLLKYDYLRYMERIVVSAVSNIHTYCVGENFNRHPLLYQLRNFKSLSKMPLKKSVRYRDLTWKNTLIKTNTSYTQI